MRFQPLVARLAFAALGLAVLTGGAAVLGVRQGLLPDASASALMIPATALAVLALVLALLWARSALITNQGAGKRLGLLALVGAAAPGGRESVWAFGLGSAGRLFFLRRFLMSIPA